MIQKKSSQKIHLKREILQKVQYYGNLQMGLYILFQCDFECQAFKQSIDTSCDACTNGWGVVGRGYGVVQLML